jgi:hypothetical protein
MELSWLGSLPLWESFVFFGSCFVINFLLSPFIERALVAGKCGAATAPHKAWAYAFNRKKQRQLEVRPDRV